MSDSVRVTITGAAGQIGYALLFRIASGQMFGADTKIDLNLLELELAMKTLKGIAMELDDCAFPLLNSITCTNDLNEGFKDTDWALLVGAVPRKDGIERADLLNINGNIFTEQGAAIKANAKSSCKVLVVGNPCNTNALICHNASDLPNKQIFAMTMLDQNRAHTQLAQKAGVDVSKVKNLAIWGNHSPSMFADFANATINNQPLCEVITDHNWLESEFLETVGKRGSAIIKTRGASSAASAANAIIDTVRKLTTPTPEGEFFSVCVPSDGSYGTPQGLISSFPVRSNGTDYEIIQGLKHNDFAKNKLKATFDELSRERDAVSNLLK